MYYQLGSETPILVPKVSSKSVHGGLEPPEVKLLIIPITLAVGFYNSLYRTSRDQLGLPFFTFVGLTSVSSCLANTLKILSYQMT